MEKIISSDKLPKTICSFKGCKGTLDDGIALFREDKDVENVVPVFPELKRGTGMHLGCYIKHCVKRAIKRNLK